MAPTWKRQVTVVTVDLSEDENFYDFENVLTLQSAAGYV